MKKTIMNGKINIKNLALNTLYILFLVAICRSFLKDMFKEHGLGSYVISEFLINYQGGFVRRGLLGEILFLFRSVFPFDIEWSIKIFCAICYLFICTFFIYNFKKQKFSLYILPLCFFCGALVISNEYWIRKDSLMICFLIASLWIFKAPKKLPMAVKILLINILLIFIILSHEAFAFFSIPIFFVLFINYFKEKGVFKSLVTSILYLCPTIVAFLFAMNAKGNYEIAQTIWDSWHIISNKELSIVGYNNSIGALFWETIPTLKSHFSSIFLTIEWDILSLFVWIIIFPIIYYISTNFLLVFNKNNSTFNEEKKTILSALLIFQFICLLPLFLGLSKDYIRLVFYLTTSSFAIFLLIPFDTLKSLFPKIYIRFIEKLNNLFNNFISPSKSVLIIFMLIIGIPNWGFYIYGISASSMLYQILTILTKAAKPFVEFAQQILN